jgi:AraC family transcriptional regulator, melibiose operon regulatory protein
VAVDVVQRVLLIAPRVLALTLQGNSTSFNRNCQQTFLNPNMLKRIHSPLFELSPPSEGVRINADAGAYPVEVFGDHGLCAGRSTRVYAMPGPHMHSQVELNLVVHGSMTYWFDGREVALTPGRLVMFWGMIPHQVMSCAEPTEFVVLYAPMSLFIELPELGQLRDAIFRGAMIEANALLPYDSEMFQRWRLDLLKDDRRLQQIVRDEVMARTRRINGDGWKDLRSLAAMQGAKLAMAADHDRALRVESMSRFISEHALENIRANDVAHAAGLHPNYAMALYKSAMGMTIKQSITRHRIDTAQSMLIASDTPVSRAAFECGFGSISSFYAAFEKRFGTSPQMFRQTIRTHQAEMAGKA